jgi:ribosomal protein S12 methylthiotransferase
MAPFPILGQAASDSASDPSSNTSYRGNVALITLGCAKNQVDSEVMLASLVKAGFDLTSDIDEAEIAVVNTCSFLQAAIDESLEVIRGVCNRKSQGRLRKVIVAGCLVQRGKEQLKELIPEIDAFVGQNELAEAGQVVSGELKTILDSSARPYFLYDEHVPRILSTAPHTAYVKIAEGCNRPCAFCIIPKIRGDFRSRAISSVVNEVNDLATSGTREVILIAQDLTQFGKDRRDQRERLPDLLRAIDEQTEIDWVRLLYAYPVSTDRELLEAIRDLPSVCKYLDIPLQHSSEGVLKRMKRPIGKQSPRALAEMFRSEFPEIAIRSTFIVGFPGETEKDVEDLVSFIHQSKFHSVGVFTYSPEPGTPGALLDNQIEEEEKLRRQEAVMLAQQEVVTEVFGNYIGQELIVLNEGRHPESDQLLSARTDFQAPEVDGTVIINRLADDVALPEAGEFGRVLITELAGYDLVGTYLGSID